VLRLVAVLGLLDAADRVHDGGRVLPQVDTHEGAGFGLFEGRFLGRVALVGLGDDALHDAVHESCDGLLVHNALLLRKKWCCAGDDARRSPRSCDRPRVPREIGWRPPVRPLAGGSRRLPPSHCDKPVAFGEIGTAGATGRMRTPRGILLE